MPGVARNTATLLVASVLQKVVAFGYFAIIARWAGVTDTGTYFFALSWVLMFSIATDFGLTSVLIRESARDHARAEQVLNQVLSLKAPLVAFGATASILAAWLTGTHGTALLMVALGSIVLVLDAVSLTFYGLLRGHHVLAYEGVGLVISQSITLVIGGFLLKTHAPLAALMAAIIAGSLWNACAAVWVVRKKLGIRPRFAWERGLAKKIVKAAVPFGLAGAFVKIYTNVDVVLLTKFAGVHAAGLYSVPYKLTFAFQFIPMTFVAALYPAMSRAYAEDKRQLGDLLYKALWALTVIVAPIVAGLVALGPEIVRFVYGPEYEPSILPLQFLVFTLVFIFLDLPLGSLLNGSDRQATQTTLMGTAMVVSVLINVIFIPRVGVMGAVAASLVSHAVLFLGGAVAISKFLDWPVGRFVWLSARVALAAGGMGAVVWAAKAHLPLLASIALGAVAYAAFSFLLRSVTAADLRDLAGRVLKRAA